MGRVIPRLGSFALTWALALAGGMQILSAGDSFSETPAPASINPTRCEKQRETPTHAGRKNQRGRKRASLVSMPPVSGSATVLILSPDSTTMQDSGSARASVPTGTPAAGPEKGWTPAAYVNSRLPRWLRLSGQFRNRDEAPTAYSFTPGNNDAYALTHTVLDLDATPTSWLHAFVQARDAEVMGANPKNVTSSMKDAFDLAQAYIELRNADQGWFSLQVGRQQMLYGDERLVGRSDWSNASRSFDAVRLRLQSRAYGARVDVFASSVVKNYPTSHDRILPGQNFYGMNLTFAKLVPKATIEPYLYVRTLPSVTGVDKLRGNERLFTSGFRTNGTLRGGFDYKVRYSFQSGHLADDPIHAWGGYGVLGYTVSRQRLQPRFSIEYAYASGNKSMGNRVVGTFDQLYPTSHGQRGITDLFAEENIKDLKPAFDFKPLRKAKVVIMLNRLSLASRYDGLYDAHSVALIVKPPSGGALSSNIGTEADLYGTYDINPRLQFGAGIGHLYAGPFLKQNSAGASVTYPYIMLDYHL